ncbi:DNA repair helicase (rad3) [Pseudoloma neurophilia]|uniref:DNA 5'-3' helicase n=1 Tax=Pseudoloma neurophilia TaxID=146866 RepID=A0A0R0LZX7_9MICR|nr:DNA repair helicase (rad3) [Pseudoloma neurophilia]
MIFHVSQIPVYFPYETISHEQISYIKELIKSFKSKENLFVEMSAGSGKTICLLAAAVSFQIYNNLEKDSLLKRFIYCTRTVPETEKTLEELKILIKYIKDNHVKDLRFLGLGLTSRKHFCVNPNIKGNVEIECRKLLAGKGCQYFNRVEEVNVTNPETVNTINFSPISLDGVYTIDELNDLGRSRIFCPYFLIRKLTTMCNILICTFNYILDPGISEKMTFPTNPIIIFDEAHNIDNACIEAFKHEITRDTLKYCKKGLDEIEKGIKDRTKELKAQYDKIEMNGSVKQDGGNMKKTHISISKSQKGDIETLASNKFTFPGALRKDIHVISLLKRIVEFVKIKFKSTHLTINSTNSFLNSLCTMIFSNRKTLSKLYARYKQLPIVFSENTDILEHFVAFIDTLCAFYQSDAFSVIYEPNTLSSNKKSSLNIDPKLTLSCNDSRIAIRQMIKYESLIITSGTLTPFETYKDLLSIEGRTVSITGDRNPDLLIVTKGNDQLNITSVEEKGVLSDQKNHFTTEDRKFDDKDINEPSLISSSFKLRNTPSTIRNYMTLIASLSQIVPDGMIIFFPSYLFMNEIISQSNIRDFKKPVFIETVNYAESITALENYKKSIRAGRGGLFLCVARGKVSEGIDFKDHYGRGCLVIGVPFAYTESVIIQQRVRYLTNNLKITSFLQFDALRHAMQCLGRVIRGKNDYGLIIVADYRYTRYIPTLSSKYSILDSLSIDMAINYGKLFFRRMANREPIKMVTSDQVQQYIKD